MLSKSASNTKSLRVSALHAAIVGASFISATSYAGSFELTTQNIVTRSQANAGAGVLNSGAGSLYSNPALIQQLQGTQASVGATFVKPSTDISNISATPASPTDTNNGDMIQDSVVPALFFTHKPQSGVTLGVGVFSEFGFNADYEDSFAGRTFGDVSEFKTVTIAPTAGFKLNDQVNLGFSVDIMKSEGKLTSAASKTIPGSSFVLEGDDISVGYTVGAHVKPTNNIEVGLVYRSQNSINLEGDATAKLTGAATTADGSLRMLLPARTELSASFKPTDKVGLYGGVNYTQWNSLKALQIKTELDSATIKANSPLPAGHPAQAFVDQASVKLPTPPAENFNYINSLTYSAGADYKLSNMITVRGGVARDGTPTRSKYRSLRLPTTTRMLYAVGASVQVTPASSVDVGYSYVDENMARVNATNANGSSKYKADFDTSAHLLMLQYNHKF